MKSSFNIFICSIYLFAVFDNIPPITLKNPTQLTLKQSIPLYEKKKGIRMQTHLHRMPDYIILSSFNKEKNYKELVFKQVLT